MRVIVPVEQSSPPSLQRGWKANIASRFKGQQQKKSVHTSSLKSPESDTLSESELEVNYLRRPEFAWQQSQFLRREPLPVETPLPQQQSLLLRLPVEIRELVYRYVFGPSLIHIEAISHRLAHVKCMSWLPGDSWDGHLHGRRGMEAEAPASLDKDESPNDQLLAICLSCRLIYYEALPFMYATPFFTIRQPIRILVVDNTKFSESLRHIRKLSIRKHFRGFPQDARADSAPWNMTGWISLCDALASMTSLQYLCITITQCDFNYETPSRKVRYTRELLEPLKRIKVTPGGQFDVITHDWRIPCEMNDMPFRVLEEKTVSAMSKLRLRLLGGFDDPYSKIEPMSSPVSYL